MADTPPDYRDTVFLPKTDFPMKAGLAQKEPAILARWQAMGLYQRLREKRAGRERFILHDGPPYANGDIHMGHAMNKVLKDIIVRSQSLMGKDAPYIPGWDCHGLPIEWKIEEEYRKKKLNKDDVPPAEFRAECRAYAAKWVGIQSEQFQRLGVMGDWDDPYLTMKFDSEAAIVAELLKFAETGQLYRGAKPVMWSPVEKTALAEAEVEYEDITSTQIDVAFEIVDSPIEELKGAHAVVWTTTPWTIPVNQAIAYGPDVEYELVWFWASLDSSAKPDFLEDPEFQFLGNATRETKFLIASELKGAVAERVTARLQDKYPGSGISVQAQRYPNSAAFKGSDLLGTVARHPMHKLGGFFARPRPFLPGDFVTTDQGTGLVHMAPDHGEDDFELCKAHGLEPVFAVEGDGKYRADWAWLGGQGSVINAKLNAPDGPICSDLRDAGALLAASADYRHSYPHSWRSKAKVIFRATPQWFIGMDKPLSQREREGPAAQRWEGEGDETLSPSPRSPEASRPLPMGEGSNAPTLRELALDSIERTRWVPEKSRNRIAAMVEGRPDWVISRQRAWGVPIALYVNRRTGEYLRDPDVNHRIIQAFRAGGADAWFLADHQSLLGPDYDAADYEPVGDILDVWFDSGSTHVFVIEARYGMDARADLYVEGSDQHRGWFQSSLLESCGTRGRAPYAAVLTHGFALDGQGRKMSKSLGNVVDPLKVMSESGADILRMWVASTDYFEDVKIGKEVLAGASDAYRKLRNTFRYLLGALDGFGEAERTTEFPELERYILHRLAELDRELKEAVNAFEFNRYIRRLSEFANEDLSAFLFDIRKDCLYCDAPDAPKRRAYRTVLDILFNALVRYLAPVLPFTTEEVWQTRLSTTSTSSGQASLEMSGLESVHLAEWPEVDAGWLDPALGAKWERLRQIRGAISAAIEPLRREKILGSSLEADVDVHTYMGPDLQLIDSVNLSEIAIVADIRVREGATLQTSSGTQIVSVANPDIFNLSAQAPYVRAEARKTERNKCGRCWRHLPEVPEDGALCARCSEVVGA